MHGRQNVECPGSERAGLAGAQPAHALLSWGLCLHFPHAVLSPFADGPRQLPGPEVCMISSFWTLVWKGSSVQAVVGEAPTAQLITGLSGREAGSLVSLWLAAFGQECTPAWAPTSQIG